MSPPIGAAWRALFFAAVGLRGAAAAAGGTGVVVLRVGSASTTLTAGMAAPLTLLTLDPVSGATLQSVDLPSTGSNACTQ